MIDSATRFPATQLATSGAAHVVDQGVGKGEDDQNNRHWGGQRVVALNTASLATGSAQADANHPGGAFVTSLRLFSGSVTGGVTITDGAGGPVIGYVAGAVAVNQQIVLDNGNAVMLQSGLYINAVGTGSCIWTVLGGNAAVN